MKSIFLLCSIGAVSSYASECQADEHSLLQARRLLRTTKTMGSKDSIAMLKNMRDVAESLLDGSDTTMSPDEVNEALDSASEILAALSPLIRQQIENAQQQITDAASAVQMCHPQNVAELMSSHWESTGQRAAAVESCHDTLDQLRTAETQQCNIAEDCLCDEARVRTTYQEPFCAAITELYEVAFCEHHHVCNIVHQCHSQEAQVYQTLREDVEREMSIAVQEYIAVEQSRCLADLVREAWAPPITPISHAALIACDDVDVSALNITFPDLPSEPDACPAHTHGDPQCEFLAGYGHAIIGACRTADDGDGSGLFRGVQADGLEQCASECDASPTCFAFEFVTQLSGTTGCELHRQPMPAGNGAQHGRCYNKILTGPVLEGYGPANVGACRTADGGDGSDMFRGVHADSLEQCASECEASPTCLAFEFGTHSSGRTGCELHRQPMPAANGGRSHFCYNSLGLGSNRQVGIKCPLGTADVLGHRLFREPATGVSSVTRAECHALCRTTNGCNHYSIAGTNDHVCTGCSSLENAQQQSNAIVWDM